MVSVIRKNVEPYPTSSPRLLYVRQYKSFDEAQEALIAPRRHIDKRHSGRTISMEALD